MSHHRLWPINQQVEPPIVVPQVVVDAVRITAVHLCAC